MALGGCGTMRQSGLPGVEYDSGDGLQPNVRAIAIDANVLSDPQDLALPASDAGSPPPVALSRWDYRIGRGDVLSIVVWDHPQLTIPAGPLRTPAEAGNTVHTDGSIFYPFIGTLQVAGKTVTEVRRAIAAGLSNVIPNPQVDVSVAKFGSKRIHVTGAVKAPRSIPVTNIPATVMDAVELAQGFSELADVQRVKLLRNDIEYVLNLELYLTKGDKRQNPRLEADDIVVVPEAIGHGVYVLGEVAQPGPVPLPGTRRISLTDALARSGGIDKRSANAKGVFVFRALAENNVNVYQLDVTDPLAFLLGTRFPLTSNDVVYVTSAPAARWNRVISNIIPSLGILNTLILLDRNN
jgi:polysaccharide export outer membrane protein